MALPKVLTTVTPLSKIVALIMFISLPVISFLYGIYYEKNNYINNENNIATLVPTSNPTVTPTDMIDQPKNSTCPPEAQDVANKYNIDTVKSCLLHSFYLDEKTINFIQLTYGKGMDCIGGCIFSHYCAIVEDGIDYPYHSDYWYDTENILKLSSRGTSSADKLLLIGKTHRITITQEFKTFMKSEPHDSFGLCDYES